MTILETPRLILRHFQDDDVDAMNSVLGDAEVMRFSEGTKAPGQVSEWIQRWIDDLYDRWGFGLWAVVERRTGLTIGYCGLTRFPGRCAVDETEIGFRLSRTFWGQGFATETATAVRDHAFGTLRLPKLIAMIDPANVRSVRVVQKVGFRYEREAMLEGYDHPDHVYSLTRDPGVRPRG